MIAIFNVNLDVNKVTNTAEVDRVTLPNVTLNVDTFIALLNDDFNIARMLP